MNKPNHRVIQATVAGVSLLVVIVLGLPRFNEGRQLSADLQAFTKLEQEFESTQQRNRRLSRIEQKLHSQKEVLINQNVTPEQISGVRDELIAIVRKHGGSLRLLEIQDGQSRVWGDQGDDPHNRDRPEMGMESEFELHSHTVSLAVTGSLKAALAITRTLSDGYWLVSIETMVLKPRDSTSRIVSLELGLTLFGLTLVPEPVEEQFASL
ncbi:hypothetical protein [Neorhodopirellula lusitana]|uniref:hypothetical protein n=1 Tax=Neorhodopirellula lusitana TaxID=445327 RepID=UPI00384E94EC